VSDLGVPHSAREIVETAEELGFKLIRETGKSHLVFAKPGVPGVVVASGTPRSSETACKKVRCDCRRLMERSR
jgi:predicted RNA binding protein YcfA (HicA-like mRNA interferase family)